MNPNLPQPPQDEPQGDPEVRLTALLLGELPESEAAALRDAMGKDPALAALYNRLEKTIGLVREAVSPTAEPTTAANAPLQLTGERREKLLASFKIIPSQRLAKAPRWKVPWRECAGMAALFVALCLLAGAVLFSRIQGTRSFAYLQALGESESAEGDAKARAYDVYFKRNLGAVASKPAPIQGQYSSSGRAAANAAQSANTPSSPIASSAGGVLDTASGPSAPGQVPSRPVRVAGGRAVEDTHYDLAVPSEQLSVVFAAPVPPVAPAIGLPELALKLPLGGQGAARNESIQDAARRSASSPQTRIVLPGQPEPAPARTPEIQLDADSPLSSVNGVISAGEQPGQWARHAQPVQSATFSSDATRLLTRSPDNTVQLWNAQTGAKVGEPIQIGQLDFDRSSGGVPGAKSSGTEVQRLNRGAAVLPAEVTASPPPPTAAEPVAEFAGAAGGVPIEDQVLQLRAGQKVQRGVEKDAKKADLGDQRVVTNTAFGYAVDGLSEVRDRFYSGGEGWGFGGRAGAQDKERADGMQLSELTKSKGVRLEQIGLGVDDESGLAVHEAARRANRPETRQKELHDDLQAWTNAGVSLDEDFLQLANATPPAKTDPGSLTALDALGRVGKLASEPPAGGKPVTLEDKNKIEVGTLAKPADTEAKDVKAKLELAKLPELKKRELKEEAESEPSREQKPAPPPVPQPEVSTQENPFSTFSLNVSDVSFKLAAAALEKGTLPDPSTVRSEEFINAFDYRDPEPRAGAPVAFAWERARYPFAHNRDLLRFSIKTAASGRQAGRPLNLVLLLDNSGSMERADRVSIIRECLRVLATQLRPEDRVSVVAFARTPRLWIDALPGSQASELVPRVGGLTPQGGTNLEDAMNLAYQTALRHYFPTGMNRVVLLTDGAANLGEVSPASLQRKVEAHRKQGIALDCFGIGWEGYNDDLLEVLSRNGDGRYGFVNNPEAAATEFARQLAGALQVAASDVKVQVQFNPQRVTMHRQIGYAKHQLKKEQFRDNTVDAAEISAAEAGNALYLAQVQPQGEGPIATVRVRYKVPGTSSYHEHEWVVPFNGAAPALEQSTPTLRLAGAASAFSEWLVSSPFAAEVAPAQLLGLLSGVPETYPIDPRPKKLEWMIRQAKAIAGK